MTDGNRFLLLVSLQFAVELTILLHCVIRPSDLVSFAFFWKKSTRV